MNHFELPCGNITFIWYISLRKSNPMFCFLTGCCKEWTGGHWSVDVVLHWRVHRQRRHRWLWCLKFGLPCFLFFIWALYAQLPATILGTNKPMSIVKTIVLQFLFSFFNNTCMYLTNVCLYSVWYSLFSDILTPHEEMLRFEINCLSIVGATCSL